MAVRLGRGGGLVCGDGESGERGKGGVVSSVDQCRGSLTSRVMRYDFLGCFSQYYIFVAAGVSFEFSTSISLSLVLFSSYRLYFAYLSLWVGFLSQS